MNSLAGKDLFGMAAEAVFINWLDVYMRLVTLIAVEPGHGRLCRKGRNRNVPVAREAHIPVRDELTTFTRCKGMAGHARD